LDPVAEALARIVTRFHPVRVILFGSWVSGTARPDSDVDLVVIVATGSVSAGLDAAMHGALRGLRASFNLVVADEDRWNRWATVPLPLEHRIARDGKVLFDAAA